MNPIGGPNSVAQRAQAALQALPQAATPQEKITSADAVLVGIANDSADPLEKALSKVARQAVGGVTHESGKLAVLEASLEALSRGVSGTVGGALAAVALDAMARASQVEDQSNLATYFLAGVNSEGSDVNEKLLGANSQKLMNELKKYPARIAVAQAACNELARGSAGSATSMLAGMALQVMPDIGTGDSLSQCTAAAHYLNTIHSNTSGDEHTLVADACKVYNAVGDDVSRVAVTQEAMQALSGFSGSVVATLASMGLKTLSNLDVNNGGKASAAFLNQIHPQTSGQDRLFIDSACKFYNATSSSQIRIDITRLALQVMAAGVPAAIGPAVSQLGLDSLAAIDPADAKNLALVAAAILNQLTAQASDDEKSVAFSACKAYNAVKNDEARAAVGKATAVVVEAGISGVSAGGLASLGLDMLNAIDAGDHQSLAGAGAEMLGQVGEKGAGVEALLGQAGQLAVNAIDNYATRAAVSRLALDGVARGTTGAPGQTLASQALEVLTAVPVGEGKNRALVAAQYLNTLQSNGDDTEKALCRVGIAAYNEADQYATRTLVAEAVFAAVDRQNHSGLENLLATVGLESLANTPAAEEKNKATIGTKFLSGIQSESKNTELQELAKISLTAGNGLDTYSARNQVFQAALERLQNPPGGSLAHQLAHLGAEAFDRIAATEVANRAKLAGAFVAAIAQHGTEELRAAANQVQTRSNGVNEWQGRCEVLSEFLRETARLAPNAPVAPAPPVAPAAPVDETAAAVAVDPQKQVNDELLALWGGRLDEALGARLSQGVVPDPGQLAISTYEAVWPELQKRLPDQNAQAEDWKSWAYAAVPPLKFGETFPPHTVSAPVYSGETQADRDQRKQTVEKISKFEVPAEQADLDLLRQALDGLGSGLLQELTKRGYTFSVTRDRVSNADEHLAGKMTGSTLTDMHDGAHLMEKGEKPRIVVRSFWKDGRLQLDPVALLREVGRGYDQLMAAQGGKPSHEQTALADACIAEFHKLPPRFHDQASFVAEAYARFQLDRERMEREMPLTTAAFAAGPQGKHQVNARALAELQSSPPPVVNVHPDPLSEMRAQEGLNRLRKLKGMQAVPYVFEVQGEAQHNVKALVSHLGRTLRSARNPGVPSLADGEEAVRISSATFNNPEALEKVLKAQAQVGRGSLLVLDELAQIPANSPGFEKLGEYIQRFGGQCPLLLQGSSSDLQRLRGALPTAVTKRFTTEPLTASMITELVAQTARQEGYDISAEAMAAIAGRAKDGELGQMFTFWRAIKSAQTERDKLLLPYLSTSPEGARRVLTSDVTNAKLALDRDPLDEVQRMVGLGNAKRELQSVLAQVKLQKHQEAHGMAAERPRLNLLFEGNPGTGKTTVAKLFAGALTRVGYLKNNKFHEVRVQDLVSGKPEENVKKLFEENKGSVIFVDEMHQLKDTAEGRLAFRAMIPYLGHPEYADTVFIGAGYPGEMRDLIRDVDDGAERRFTAVPFDDYSRSELGSILDKMSADKQRVLDEPTRDAALLRLERERRKMKNFGNAGSVASLLDIAIKKQTARLGEAKEPLTKVDFTTLLADDFVMEKTLSPAEVWKEIDALEGLDLLKKELRTLCASIEYDREMGNDPLESFEPYFILDGPPGTGKTTMARLIVKLMAAYDIIPDAGISESQGADLQAGFVGQTTTKVQKLFESMWGQGGFIDEIGGLARAPEAFQADAAKTMLKQMEDHRGRFILVVADYADRVNEFLNIDPGIARRFGHRFSLEPLSAEGAVKSLSKQLVAKDMALTEETSALIAARMKDLQAAPGWASSGDVRKLLNTIVTQQKTAFMEARAEGRKVDPKVLLPAAVEAGFATLMREKAAKGPAKSTLERMLTSN